MQLTRRLHLLHPAHTILAVAWAGSMALGCSSEHLLGDLSEADLNADGDASSGGGRDFLASSLLGPPDVTFGNDTSSLMSYAARLGDLDGDGFGEFATRNWDVETGVQYVHIRYGVPRQENRIQEFAWTEGGARLTVAEGFSDLAIVPLGDVDADGHSDFLVALGSCDAMNQGAFLVYGSPARLDGVRAIAETGVFLQGPRPAGALGCAADLEAFAAALGDFDGDGFDDFVLTDPRHFDLRNLPEIGPRYPGGAYLFYGRAERLANGTSWLSADVRLHAPQTLNLTPTGDINADGLGDLILGDWDANFPPGYAGPAEPGAFYWLPGRATRLSADVDLPTLATSAALGEARTVGDLDGDGVNDVLLDAEGRLHLFYGAPALFDSGVDLSLAAATFEPYPGNDLAHLVPSNDRDGDGDDELISVQLLGPRGFTPQLVALISGSAARLSGNVALPEPGNPHSDSGTTLGTTTFVESIFPVGDLDGDGAGDLLTRSNSYPDEVDEDGYYRHLEDDAWERARLHIHYGIPGGLAVPLR